MKSKVEYKRTREEKREDIRYDFSIDGWYKWRILRRKEGGGDERVGPGGVGYDRRWDKEIGGGRWYSAA